VKKIIAPLLALIFVGTTFTFTPASAGEKIRESLPSLREWEETTVREREYDLMSRAWNILDLHPGKAGVEKALPLISELLELEEIRDWVVRLHLCTEIESVLAGWTAIQEKTLDRLRKAEMGVQVRRNLNWVLNKRWPRSETVDWIYRATALRDPNIPCSPPPPKAPRKSRAYDLLPPVWE